MSLLDLPKPIIGEIFLAGNSRRMYNLANILCRETREIMNAILSSYQLDEKKIFGHIQSTKKCAFYEFAAIKRAGIDYSQANDIISWNLAKYGGDYDRKFHLANFSAEAAYFSLFAFGAVGANELPDKIRDETIIHTLCQGYRQNEQLVYDVYFNPRSMSYCVFYSKFNIYSKQVIENMNNRFKEYVGVAPNIKILTAKMSIVMLALLVRHTNFMIGELNRQIVKYYLHITEIKKK